GLKSPVLHAAHEMNEYQQESFINRIVNRFGGDVAGKHFAVWGASFKPGTDDLRNAPALRVMDALLKAGASVAVFDPVSSEPLHARYGDRIEIGKRMYDILEGADALIVCTE